ncbi:hypothetical protein HID58_053048, partial [Brassica napus]
MRIPTYTLITLPSDRKIHTLIMAKTYLPLFESALGRRQHLYEWALHRSKQYNHVWQTMNPSKRRLGSISSRIHLSKERKEKALKEIEMRNAAYKATILCDLLGTISSYQSKATFVAYKQCFGNKMDKVNEILNFGFSFDISKTRCSNSTLEKVMKINNNQIDDERRSSLSMIHEDIIYNDLIGLPPVFIRNDHQVTSCMNKIQENGGLYLCVTIKTRDEVLITHDLHIARNSNLLETRDEVLITYDLPIAGSRNFFQRGAQILPLIMSNMIQTRDGEISSTHDSPIVGSSNAFERGTQTHPETEWNNIHRVDEVSGIQHMRIRNSLISPSNSLVSNK